MPFGVYAVPSSDETLVEITGEEFALLRTAKRNLVIVQSVEEKLTILLENYAEFETTLLSETVHNVVFQPTAWSAAVSLIYTLNRRLVNLLTSCRLYVDHVKHDLSSMYGRRSGIGEKIVEECSRQYENKLGYRVMEALRNYVQHRGLPVDSADQLITVKGAPAGFAANIITPYLDTRRIKEDGGFKSEVLTELLSRGEKIDLKPLIREYIEGIEEVHRAFRTAVSDDARQWETTLRTAMEHRREPNRKLPSLYVVHTDDAGDIIEEVQVFEAIVNRREELERRVPLYGNLSKQIVTSEARGSRKHGEDE